MLRPRREEEVASGRESPAKASVMELPGKSRFFAALRMTNQKRTPRYSTRKACTGFTAAARRAGMMLAIKAQSPSNTTAAPSTSGSHPFT